MDKDVVCESFWAQFEPFVHRIMSKRNMTEMQACGAIAQNIDVKQGETLEAMRRDITERFWQRFYSRALEVQTRHRLTELDLCRIVNEKAQECLR
jgi:hypothetical protein